MLHIHTNLSLLEPEPILSHEVHNKMTERGQNVYMRYKMLQDLYLLCKYITSVISATSLMNNT